MQFSCDNAAVVSLISSGRAKDLTLAHLLHYFFFVEARYKFQADALPRDNMPFLLSQAPQEFWIPCISNTKRIGQHTGYPQTQNS